MLASNKVRSRCFFDIKIGDKQCGRIIFELFDDICPKTCENFRCLCTGEMGIGKTTGKPLHYKDVIFHRVVKNFMIQGGDFSNGNGRGGESIYSGSFKDENFEVKHDKPFFLSMANRGPNTNGSQFFIITKPAPHLDGVHVVFGHVISGSEIVTEIENQPTDKNNKPITDVVICNCGELIPQIKPKLDKKKKRKSLSDDGDEKVKRHKKKHKKHKKTKKSSPKSEKKEIEASKDDGLIECSVKPNEIPEIPSHKFLMRGTVNNQTESKDKASNRERDDYRYRSRVHLTRSGRKFKGRGLRRYRTPSPGERSGSETPPHWKYAQSRVKSFNDKSKNDKSKDELIRDDRYREDKFREERLRNERFRHERFRDDKYREERSREERFRDERLREERSKDENSKDERSREERSKDERFREERAREERPREEKFREEKFREERLREERFREERSKDERLREERPKDERLREERSRDERPREEKFREEKAREERFREERFREERFREERFREERPREEKSREERSREERFREERSREEKSKDERSRDERSKEDKLREKGRNENSEPRTRDDERRSSKDDRNIYRLERR